MLLLRMEGGCAHPAHTQHLAFLTPVSAAPLSRTHRSLSRNLESREAPSRDQEDFHKHDCLCLGSRVESCNTTC